MHDAIVIGAGLSGLVCARRLAAGGAKVLVVEARDRVGGRLFSGTVGGALVDLGGQWLTAGQTRLAALAAELGVATFEHRRTGGRLVIDEAGGLTMKILGAFAQQRAMKSIEALMRSVPLGEPARAPQAAVLDRLTLGAWLDDKVRNTLARERIRLHADLVFAADPADLSLLSYLATMRATDGFRPGGADLPGGGREHRFEGGAQQLAERIAAGLEVQLGEPVRGIAETATGVSVRCATSTFEARRVVLAIPPGLARAIDMPFAPAQRTFVDGVRAGAVIKCFAAYEQAFWRTRGYSGEAYLPRGSVRAVVEIAGEPPALLAFVVGPYAARWRQRTAEERRGEILATLSAYFGDEARTPVGYLEHDWAADPWSAGCVAATPPGVLARGARWRESHGKIHLAGTETAVLWPGYMEGAIEAGERAGSEVLAALG